jgi:hypothetical protein
MGIVNIWRYTYNFTLWGLSGIISKMEITVSSEAKSVNKLEQNESLTQGRHTENT